MTLCRLFTIDPLFPLHQADPALDFKDVRGTRDVKGVLMGLCEMMRHFELADLSKAARAALLRLHEPAVMRAWLPHAPLVAFWELGPAVLGQLSDVLLHGRDYSVGVVHVLVTTIETIMESRNGCIVAMAERDPPAGYRDHISFCVAKLEAALLVALAAVDSSVCTSAAASLGLCCDETDILGTQVPTSLVANYASYRKISSSTASVVGGRVHQQKQFHNVFFRQDLQTPGNITAWEELWHRWNVLTAAFVSSGGDVGTVNTVAAGSSGSSPLGKGNSGALVGIPGSSAVSTSGSISSLGSGSNSSGSGGGGSSGSGDGSGSSGREVSGSGSALIMGSGSNMGGSSASAIATSGWAQTLGLLGSLAGVVEDRPLPRQVVDFFRPSSSPVGLQLQSERNSTLVQFFFAQLIDLLIADSLTVREGTRSVVASSLSPLVIAPFLRLLHSVVRSFFDESGLTARRGESECVLLVDQAVSIWKLYLDRKLVQSDLESLSSVFEELLLCLARYIAQLLIEKSPHALHIRLKFCALVESVCENSSIVPWTNQRQVRETLVEIMMEWTSVFGAKESINTTPRSMSGNNVASLYDGLAPQIGKLVKDLDVAVVGALATLLTDLELEGDTSTSRAEKFTKLFSFLTSVLRIARRDHGAPPKLPDIAITALSELLAANTEAGLPYFVTMGYNKDVGLRTAFLQVLTTILKEGTSLNASNSAVSKYSNLVELLLDDSMELCLALCETVPIAEADELAEILTNIFEANGQMQLLIKISIAVEVAKTSGSNTLFRRNSIATKIMTNFARFAGQEYLQEAILPVMRSLLSSNMPCELDKAKLPSGQTLEQNCKNVIKLSQKILDRLQETVQLLPRSFREVCGFLSAAVAKKFPGCSASAVGGFMFLRFLCPALVSPEAFGLIRTVAGEARRALVLVAKTLQNLANMVVFGSKEEYMVPLNPFIEANIPVIRTLLMRYARVPIALKPNPPLALSEEEKSITEERLHYYLGLNLPGVQEALQRSAERQTVSGKLRAAMSALGVPPEHNPKRKLETASSMAAVGASTGVAKATAKQMKLLMAENKGKKTDVLLAAKVFYRSPALSKRGNPVFIYNVQNWNQRCDCSLLLYHMIQLTSAVWNASYELVIDATDTRADHYMGEVWWTRLSRLLAPEVLRNCVSIVVINFNKATKKLMTSRWFQHLLVPSQVANRLTFVSSLDEVAKVLDVRDGGLLPATASALTMTARWSELEQLNRGAKKRADVALRLCKDVIQIEEAPVALFGGLFVQPLQNIHISLMADVAANAEGTELTLRFRGLDGALKVLCYKTKAATQICSSVMAVRTRFEISSPAASSIKTRQMTTSDVPGTLLNLALLNLGSPDPLTRTAGYNLLTAVCSYFHYDPAASLLEATGLCVPKTNSTFVVRLSAQLATSLPHLTLEFIPECLHGLVTASFEAKHLCLAYLQPWIPNLRGFVAGVGDAAAAKDKTERLAPILKQFAQLSVKEAEIRPAILAKIWKPLGKIPELLDTSLDAVVSFAGSTQQGIYSEEMASMVDAVVTMASQNASLVTGKLVERLMNALRATGASDCKDELCEHKLFPAISQLTRFLLMVSFDNLIDVQHFLPEVVFICSMLFAQGDWVERVTVHRLLINVVHSAYLLQQNLRGVQPPQQPQLKVKNRKKADRTSQVRGSSRGSDRSAATSSAVQVPEGDAQDMHGNDHVLLYLKELDDPRVAVHFGFGQHLSLSPFSNPADLKKKGPPAKVPLESAQAVSLLMRHIVDALGPDGRAQGTPWFARWLELTRGMAFAPNPALQPRAMVMLGALLLAPHLCTDKTVGQLTAVLLTALERGVRDDLAVAVLMTLTQVVPHLQTPVVRSLFWLGTALLHLGSVAVFSATLALVDNCVKAADARNCFEDASLEEYFMEARQKNSDLNAALHALEKSTTISYESNFSFAFCGALLKGLKNARTRQQSVSVLSSMLNIGGNFLRPESLGYLAAILPYKASLEKVGNREGRAQFFWTRELIPSAAVASLLFSVWVALLKGKAFEAETHTLYTLLDEGVTFEPSVAGVQADLLPHMREVVQSGKDADVVATVLRILTSLSQHKQMRSAATAPRSDKPSRVEWDFATLRDGFGAPTDAATLALVQRTVRELTKQ